MKLTRQNVEHIAHLARLEIGPDELDGVVEKLGRIVSFVDQLQSADTMDMTQRLRPDAVTETDHRDLYQQNSEAVQDGLYTVPRVLE